MEGQTSRSLNSFSLFCSELTIKLEELYKNTIKLTSSVVHVLCGFSRECLKTSREFSLISENTVKMSCYFMVSFT